jgi:hypothetical protein
MIENGAITEDPDEIEKVEAVLPFMKSCIEIYEKIQQVFTKNAKYIDKHPNFNYYLFSLGLNFIDIWCPEKFIQNLIKSSSQQPFITLLEYLKDNRVNHSDS